MLKKKAIMAGAILLIFGLTMNDSKVAAVDQVSEIIQAVGIMDTDKGSNHQEGALVTRGRFAQMLINLSDRKDEVTAESNTTLFSDVKKNYWAAGYIKDVVAQGWMSGYLNGSFKPEQGVTLQEGVYAVLRVLGYTNADFSTNKLNAIAKLYTSKGLGANLSKSISKNGKEYLTVADCTRLFYNALNATTKEGKVYAAILGYSIDTSNKIDYLSLVNKDISGPIVVDGNWRLKIPFTISEATMYKYGTTCNYTDIKDYDIIYYSEKFKTIWVYDEKVTGTIEAINPDYSNPTSVTIAGVTYNFDNTEVTLQFSNMGNLKVGQTITLLLGKNNTIVDVLQLDEYNTTISGVVLSTGSHMAENTTGNYSSTYYVTFVDAAGNEHTQDYDSTSVYLLQWSVVKLSYVDGIATLTASPIAERSFGNNTFSKDAKTFGDLKLAGNIKILDLKGDQYISVNPERLAGVTLGSGSVYYYNINSDGQLSELILNDITGDMDSYGIFTGMTYPNTGSKISYDYMLGSQKGSLVTEDISSLSLEVGPKSFTFKNNSLVESEALTGISVTSVGATTIQSQSTVYPLDKNCKVYILADGQYISTTIDKITNLTKYKVKAYYDKLPSSGGKVRILVAESIK